MKKRLFSKKKNKREFTYFKIPLNEIMTLECEKGRSFPSIFEDIIEVLEKHFGLGAEGIFRQCGKSLEVLNFKKLYNENLPKEKRIEALKASDRFTVAVLLKQFLTDLPDPLLTKSLYDLFIYAGKNTNKNARIENYKLLVNGLPQINLCVLKYLLPFLARVSLQSKTNKMTIDNLSIVFGPTLLRSSVEPGTGCLQNPTQALIETRAVSMIVGELITYHGYIFGTESVFKDPEIVNPPVFISIPPPPPPPQPPQEETKAKESELTKRDSKKRKTGDKSAVSAGSSDEKKKHTHHTKHKESTKAVPTKDEPGANDSGISSSGGDDYEYSEDDDDDDYEEEEEEVEPPKPEISLYQWEIIKDSIKSQLVDFDAQFMEKHGRAPSDLDKEPIKHLYKEYKHVRKIVLKMREELAAAEIELAKRTTSLGSTIGSAQVAAEAFAKANALPPPYDEMSTEQLEKELEGLHREKKALQKFLNKWAADFQVKHKRPVKTEIDKQPIQKQYNRYKELKSLVVGIEQQIQCAKVAIGTQNSLKK